MNDPWHTKESCSRWRERRHIQRKAEARQTDTHREKEKQTKWPCCLNLLDSLSFFLVSWANTFLFVVGCFLAYEFALCFPHWSLFSWTAATPWGPCRLLLALPTGSSNMVQAIQMQRVQEIWDWLLWSILLVPSLLLRHHHAATLTLAESLPWTSPFILCLPQLPFLPNFSAPSCLPESASPMEPGPWCEWIWDSHFCLSASGQGTLDESPQYGLRASTPRPLAL